MVKQRLIAAGGKGTRLGGLARKYGNKSLIPVQGQPLLLYTINWIKQAGITELIVSVNYRREYRRIQSLLRGQAGIKVVLNPGRKISLEAVHYAASLLKERFMFIYGHAPAPPQHLKRLLATTDAPLVASLYKTTSQGEANKKTAKLTKNGVKLDTGGKLFLEPPYILNRKFCRLSSGVTSWKKAFQFYPQQIAGVVADHPHEFHYPDDFELTRRFLERMVKINKQG